MWFVFAAAAATCFGIRGILYQWTSQRPIERNLLLFGVYLSGTLIALGVNVFAGQPWGSGVIIGLLMGGFSFIANASMYKGYAVGKASIIALFTGLPPVIVVIAAYLLWGETLNLWQLLSFVVVILGLLLIKYSQDFKLGQLKGIQWGLLTMLFFGLTDLSSKQATLLGASTLPVLAVMYGTGATLFGTQWAINRLKASRHTMRIAAAEVEGSVLDADTAPETVVVPVQWSNGKTLGWGMFVGISNIAGMVFLIPAFREGVTGIVSAISAMNVVFVLLYARFYLKEVMSRREIMGLSLALAGIVLLRLLA
ncbi:EamA family transporter [Paenibacillus anaericanus]|uniref:EamA family transporter n=1 Tax=Paenibacillus anaericanus TaxID=170367 RepID=A0A3S1DQZ3_9BACL|nr:DMT family transporter [Paenibacillus anaericanus]RUT45292.1 EamA family transporter [Paenibacillus anaericanus]